METATTTKKPNDYTEGSILSAIIKMGLPSMLGFMIQHIYLMVDTYWVSNLEDGETAIAAVTFFNAILWFFFAFNQLVGPGSVAIISRRYGEKEFDLAEKAIKETLLLKLFFGGIIGAIGYLLVDQMLVLMGAEGLALERGIAYGQIVFIFLPISYATYSLFTAMRGVANPNLALGLMLGSSLLNMALDPLLIYGYWGFPAYGIKGAAIASAISFSLTFLVGLGLFYAGKANVSLKIFGGARMTLTSMWHIVKIGIPAWLADMSFSGSRLIITPIIATFGSSVVAAYGISLQIWSLGVMIIVGIGMGLSALIGQTLGAGKPERAKKTADKAILLSITIMSTYGLIVWLLAPELMAIFLDNPDTIATGVTLIRIVSLAFPAIGGFLAIEQIHMGVGLNQPTMVISVIHSWILQVIPIVVAIKWFGAGQSTVWWLLAQAGWTSVTIFYLYYRRGRWLTIKV